MMEQLPGIMLLDSKNNTGYVGAKAAWDFYDSVKDVQNLKNGANKFTGCNEYGMIDYVGMTSFGSKSNAGEVDELEAALESLSNITISSVLAHAGDDEKKKTDPALWFQGYNALIGLFCSSCITDQLDYNDKNMGREAVNKVMAAGFDVAGQPTGRLETEIDLYLQKQGDLINTMGYDGTKKNTYMIFGYANYDKNGKRACYFKAINTVFTVEGVKISRTCKDPQLRFNFDFKATRHQADFMLANWMASDEFRVKVKDFIKKHTQQDDPFFDILETGRKFKV